MALNNMNKLRVLCLRHLWYLCISCQDGSIEYLSNNLRWLAWDYYAWESLPDNFEPKKLVHLELHYSSLHHLWTEPKNLWYLRSLDLRQSDRLIQGPDFTGMPNLEVLHLPGCSILEAIHPSLGNCRKLIQLDLSGCASLRMFPCFNVESLEYLDLSFCESLEEVDHSLGCCKKLICLDLKCCFSLERFPCVNVESLEYLGLYGCSSLEKFPEILGSMKSELRIDIQRSGIRELPLSAVDQLTHIISELNLSGLKNLVALPDNICKLKSLKVLTVSGCSKLESLPEEIGELESLEKLEAQDTLIYQLPSSITQLNKLKKLDFSKQKLEEAQATVQFVFPRMNKGLRSLEELHLNFCNLIDGGLPEDIGCLSSLHWLYLKGNNFDHLPQSISQLGALTLLNVSHCKRLKQLPELPQNVKSLWADCHVSQSIQKYKNLNYVEFTPLSVEFDDSISDLFAQTLLQCILSFQKALSVSDSLSQGVFKMWHPGTEIPDWFKYHCGPAGKVLLVNLPENWYANGNFLGFAICYCAYSRDTFLELIVLSNEDKSVKLRKNIHIQSPTRETYGVNFFFLPLSSLWDTSKGNEKTPNAYGHLKFSLTSTNMSDFGFRLVYKDEPELEALLRRSESDGKSPELYNGIKRTRYDNSERHDLVTDEASCSSSKKQRAHSNICESFVLKNLQLQEGPMPSNLASLS